MNLPDALLEHAKAVAAKEGSTVTALVVEGLRLRVESRGREAKPIALPSRNLGGASVDLADNRAVLDVLDSDDDSVRS